MILAEEEAKTKWCPFARSYDYPSSGKKPVTVNRRENGRPDDWCLCIASQCMAWTWLGGPAGPKLSGYCGLARQDARV